MKTLMGVATAGVCALLMAGFIVPVGMAQQDKEVKIVRPLKFPSNAIDLGRDRSKLVILTDAAEVEKLLGKDVAKELVRAVDFAKEKIVLVRWNTGGPPRGTWQHEVIGKGKDRRLNFFVQGPPPGDRNDALFIRTNLFAVARDLAVSLEPKERPGRAPTEQKVEIRPLKFKPDLDDPTIEPLARAIRGNNKLVELTNAAAVEQLVGKEAAKELVNAVDFDKVKIVLVSWRTGGPPFGTLEYEVIGSGTDRKLNFFVLGPRPSEIRRDALRIHADFFAIPKDQAVSFEPKERPRRPAPKEP